MDYTIDDLKDELLQDENWDVPKELREAFLSNIAWTLYTM